MTCYICVLWISMNVWLGPFSLDSVGGGTTGLDNQHLKPKEKQKKASFEY